MGRLLRFILSSVLILVVARVASAEAVHARGGRASMFAAAYPQAQGGASLNGTVRDSDGKAIPGASVTLSGNGVEKTLVCNEGGEYQFTKITSGDYKLKASASGYKTLEMDVSLIGRRSLEIDAPLIPLLKSPDSAGKSTVPSGAPADASLSVPAASAPAPAVPARCQGIIAL